MEIEKERQLSFMDFFQEKNQLEEHLAKERMPVSLLLDGLSNPRNVGMIFRLAEAARVKCIYTYKMDHLEKSKKMMKASRSTDQYLDVKPLKNITEIASLKENYDLIGLELTTRSKNYTSFKVNRPVILIIGNEKSGISQELIDLALLCIHIPMLGIKTSMNVAIATGIAVYSLLDSSGKLQGLP